MAAKAHDVLRAIDKFDRLGHEGVAAASWEKAEKMKAAISQKVQN